MSQVRVVGAAIVRGAAPDAEVLATQRGEPPALAGQWEFPGGKVEAGESLVDALAREVLEELGLVVEVGGQVGPEVSVAGGRYLLRVHLARVVRGDLRLHEHTDARWLAADDLGSVRWIEADVPIVTAVAGLLRGPGG